MQVQLDKGPRVTLLSAITDTTTSVEQRANGHNAIILYNAIASGTWSIKIQGKAKDGTYMDMYDNNGDLMGVATITASQGRFIAGLPEYFKIVATEVAAGEATIGYELLTV